MTLMAKLQAAAAQQDTQTILNRTEWAFNDILKVQRYLRHHRLPTGRRVIAPAKIKGVQNSPQFTHS